MLFLLQAFLPAWDFYSAKEELFKRDGAGG